MATEKIETVFTAKDQASPTINKLKGNISKLGGPNAGPLGNMAKGFGAGAVSGLAAGAAFGMLTDALQGAGQFMGESINLASDLNETINKSDTIFGDNAAKVKSWSEGMSDAFGQTQKDALDAAGTFGGLFKTVGESSDEAAQHAMKMTELGSDLASFFNTDVKTAVEAIRSGLSGESEPLRKFNVFLSETAVNAKAAAMGLTPVNGRLTEQQKIMARYQIILDQTSDAQGDFAKTSDSMANSSKILVADVTEMQTSFGQALLPAMVNTVNYIKNEVIPGFTSLGNTIGQFFAPRMNIAGQALDSISHDMVSGIKDLRPEMDAALKGAFLGIFQPIDAEAKKAMDEAREIFDKSARGLMGDLAGALRGNKDLVADAMDAVTWAIKHPMALTRQLAAIEGALTTLHYKRGLASNTEGINTVIDQQIAVLENAWANLKGEAYGAGAATTRNFNQGLKSVDVARVFGIDMGGLFGGGGTGKKKPGKKAAGGEIGAGEWSMVGERGPEMIRAGRHGATVSPNTGNAPIIVNIDGRELFRIMDERMGKRLALSSNNAYTRS